jgi:hypothetical protein
MINWDKLTENLERRGFSVCRFASGEEAAGYLDREIDGVSVGFGGSMTVQELGLFPRLAAHNDAVWHWNEDGLARAAVTDVYICSLNGLAETGELVNIDGVGNRVASTLYGHKRVYFVVGRNKIAPDYDQALWRARNIAAPKNCRRLGLKTPCAVKADRCYSCSSPDRSCRALVVLWEKPRDVERMELVLIDEELGY